MEKNTIELIFLIVAIVFYIAAAVILLKFEKKELKKLPIEDLKKRLRSGIYSVIFFLSGGVLFYFLYQDILFNILRIINAFLWGFGMAYFWGLHVFILRKCIKKKQQEQVESE